MWTVSSVHKHWVTKCLVTQLQYLHHWGYQPVGQRRNEPPAQMLLSSLWMLIVNSAEAVPYGPTGLCGCEGVGVECESVECGVCGCEGMWHIMNRCITWQSINYCKACCNDINICRSTYSQSNKTTRILAEAIIVLILNPSRLCCTKLFSYDCQLISVNWCIAVCYKVCAQAMWVMNWAG